MIKKNRKKVYTAFTLGMIILLTLLTGGCLDSGYGPNYVEGRILVEFNELVGAFNLNRSKYEDCLKEGPINETLRKEFEKRNYSISDNATLHKADDEDQSWAEWWIYVNGTKKYGMEMEGGEESDPIWVGRKVTLDRAKEVIYSFNCTIDSLTKYDGWEATVNVPEGEEKKYVRLFCNHTAVSTAFRQDKDG